MARQARERGKLVHMGRVNSLRRLRAAWGLGADSCDGTHLARGPDINLAQVMAWRDDLNRRGAQSVLY